MFKDVLFEYEMMLSDMDEGIVDKIKDVVVPGRKKKKLAAAGAFQSDATSALDTAKKDRSFKYSPDVMKVGAAWRADLSQRRNKEHNRADAAQKKYDAEAPARKAAHDRAVRDSKQKHFSSRRTHGDWTP